jgi:hypothetical protein
MPDDGDLGKISIRKLLKQIAAAPSSGPQVVAAAGEFATGCER